MIQPRHPEVPVAPPDAGALTVGLITDDAGFAALEGEWGELYAAAPAATPFQSWEWLYSWWELYGRAQDAPHQLRLVTARDGDGVLIGLLPLMLARGGRLLFVGTGPAIYNDMLVREGWESPVAAAFAGALRGMGGWSVADLQEMRPSAAAWELVARWRGREVRVYQSYCTLVPTRPWDELLAGLRKKYRSDARRALKKAGDEGLWCVHADLDSAEEAAGRLVALNRDQWRDRWRETGPEHWTERFEQHIRRAARRATASGLGCISEFWKDGRVVLSTFLLFGHEAVGVYMVAADKEALRQYSYSSLFVWDMLERAQERQAPNISFYGGDDAYKLRWNPEVVPNHRVVLGKGPFPWLPFAGYLVLRQRAVRFARSEDSPKWARGLANGYRRLRYRVARLAGSVRGA